MKIVILGLSITSSWGNGHATTYRGLIKELSRRGHEVTFLERDVSWYAAHRDLPDPPYCSTKLYLSLDSLKKQFSELIASADLVMLGSYVPEGVELGKWLIKIAKGIKAFYDIDTPVTLAKLQRKDYEYLHPSLIPAFDLYLSFTGGPTLDLLEKKYGSPMARAFYCSVDTEKYFPEPYDKSWDLGYLGTFSPDRQPPLEHLMLEAARAWKNGKFVVAGAQYPPEIVWPGNVEYISHVPPDLHRKFYCSQRSTLNITRADMIRAGYSPSVRLFEAAACGVPIISDYWEGLDTLFDFERDIFISDGPGKTLAYLREYSHAEMQEVGESARRKVLAAHTAAHRTMELENYCGQLMSIGTKLNC